MLRPRDSPSAQPPAFTFPNTTSRHSVCIVTSHAPRLSLPSVSALPNEAPAPLSNLCCIWSALLSVSRTCCPLNWHQAFAPILLLTQDGHQPSFKGWGVSHCNKATPCQAAPGTWSLSEQSPRHTTHPWFLPLIYFSKPQRNNWEAGRRD